jgi:uncharacterized LabA/DUF88 family protein
MAKAKRKIAQKSTCYTFIDAANLFYGGQKSLGWSIDYQKLLKYLKNKFGVKKAFYYAGVELNGFPYDILSAKPLDLDELLRFQRKKIKDKNLSEAEIALLGRHLQRIKFYRKLKKFGYNLRLKPTKIYKEADRTVKKANCDVDMTFDLMRYMSQYQKLVILSGDGDFAVVLKYLRNKVKNIQILARGERTAKEIRKLAGGRFIDFVRLKSKLEFEKK